MRIHVYNIRKGHLPIRPDGIYNAGKPRTTRLDRAWARQQREQRRLKGRKVEKLKG